MRKPSTIAYFEVAWIASTAAAALTPGRVRGMGRGSHRAIRPRPERRRPGLVLYLFIRRQTPPARGVARPGRRRRTGRGRGSRPRPRLSLLNSLPDGKAPGLGSPGGFSDQAGAAELAPGRGPRPRPAPAPPLSHSPRSSGPRPRASIRVSAHDGPNMSETDSRGSIRFRPTARRATERGEPRLRGRPTLYLFT